MIRGLRSSAWVWCLRPELLCKASSTSTHSKVISTHAISLRIGPRGGLQDREAARHAWRRGRCGGLRRCGGVGKHTQLARPTQSASSSRSVKTLGFQTTTAAHPNGCDRLYVGAFILGVVYIYIYIIDGFSNII